MTNKEAVNWLINITADIGKTEHRDLWHYEQALTEIKDMLESEQPEIVRCGECVNFAERDFCKVAGHNVHRKSNCMQVFGAERRTE